MNQLEFQRNHLQMDYYSESYQDFERDFYRYSNMNIPLTFLTDDILKTMATSRRITLSSIRKSPEITAITSSYLK